MSPRPIAACTSKRGQSLVEFALVAPIFLLLFFAIIEAGRFIFYYEVLNNATREGARYAIVHGSNAWECSGPLPEALVRAPCDVTGERVKERVRATAYAMGGVVVPDPVWDPNNERSSTVTVTASYTYSAVIPIVPLPSITIRAESSLVINN